MRFLRLILVFFFLSTPALAFSQRKIHKVHYLDTKHVKIYTDNENDSTFYVSLDSALVSDWQVFYDKKLKHKAAEYFFRRDTTYIIHYYHSGKKKSEERCIERSASVYNAKYCENGRLIYEVRFIPDQLQTINTYYCNGQIKTSIQLFDNAMIWGTAKGWYENGNKEFEDVYPEFDESLYRQGLLKHELLKSTKWDSLGLEIVK